MGDYRLGKIFFTRRPGDVAVKQIPYSSMVLSFLVATAAMGRNIHHHSTHCLSDLR